MIASGPWEGIPEIATVIPKEGRLKFPKRGTGRRNSKAIDFTS